MISGIKPTDNVMYKINNTFNKTKSSFENMDIDKINEEEDKILYEKLKKAGVDLDKFTLKEQKKAIKGFPPLIAPGHVRKAWRLTMEKLSPEEKKLVRGISLYFHAFKEANPNYDHSMEKSFKGNIELTDRLLDFIKGHKYVLEEDLFEGLYNTLETFKQELNKYKGIGLR